MISPQLCFDGNGSLASVPSEGTWVMEAKLDGWRWQIHRDADGVKSYGGRNGTAYNGSVPKIEEALMGVPVGTILDGELLPVGQGLQSTVVSTRIARGGDGLQFVAFDVMQVMGTDVMHLPWFERRDLLEQIIAGVDDPLVVASPVTSVSEEVLQEWLSLGVEGAVVKRRDSPYRPGARSRDWLKIKPQSTDDAMVVGFDEGKGKYAGMVGALRLRMVDTDVETTASGMTDALRRDMTDHPDRWLGRRVEIAHHGFHPVSGVPRHPQYKRLREDLEPAPTTKETKTVTKIGKDRPQAEGAWLRNYAAMGDAKLLKVIAELQHGSGDSVDRITARNGSVEHNLRTATKVAEGRGLPGLRS